MMQAGMTEAGVIIKGYKATDENMQCRGFQFELGKWYEIEGDIELCSKGFHFCEYPSGPWSYYQSGRLFEIEAELVIKSTGPGSDLKHVAKRIRFIKEIKVEGSENTGNGNTGDWNTGNWNISDRNTGNRNTGNWNTGNRNTGDRNTGNWNTGNWNTGDRNTGNWNTGDGNTGNRNTGNWNTGNWNTGDGNTGNRNTGNGNVGNYHSGSLCCKEAPFFLFDKECNRNDVNFDIVYSLSDRMLSDELMAMDEIDKYMSLPNATVKKIIDLHKAHIKARQ